MLPRSSREAKACRRIPRRSQLQFSLSHIPFSSPIIRAIGVHRYLHPKVLNTGTKIEAIVLGKAERPGIFGLKRLPSLHFSMLGRQCIGVAGGGERFQKRCIVGDGAYIWRDPSAQGNSEPLIGQGHRSRETLWVVGPRLVLNSEDRKVPPGSTEVPTPGWLVRGRIQSVRMP